MMLGARTAAWSGKALPYLRRVAYLHTYGGQGIDTGIVPDNSTDFTIDLMVKNVEEKNAKGVFSVAGYYGIYYVNKTPRHSFGANSWLYGASYVIGRRVIVDFSATSHSILNDGIKVINLPNNVISTTRTIITDTWNSSPEIFFYGFKILKAGECVLKAIPVIDFNGRPCFYNEAPIEASADDPSRFFYNRSGEGEFDWGES